MKHPRHKGKASRQERRAERRKRSPRRELIIVRDQSASKVARYRFKHRGEWYIVTWSDGRIARVSWTPENGAKTYKQLPAALVERVVQIINER